MMIFSSIMMIFSSIPYAVIGAAGVAAQQYHSTANGCKNGFYPGTDTVLYTVPYTYAQVMSIIGDFRNITWSGSPYDSVTLNGTDNTVGTARTYDLSGIHTVETILIYSKPLNGPYEEVHALDLISIPAANVSIYSDYDGTTVTPICNDTASTFNFTAKFCATRPSVAEFILHELHLTDAKTVSKFLGGQNFSSCPSTTVGTNTTYGSTYADVNAYANSANREMASISPLVIAAAFLGWVLC